MKSTILTAAGPAKIHAAAGVVHINGAPLLPHEARLIASELDRAAIRADQLAQHVVTANQLKAA